MSFFFPFTFLNQFSHLYLNFPNNPAGPAAAFSSSTVVFPRLHDIPLCCDTEHTTVFASNLATTSNLLVRAPPPLSWKSDQDAHLDIR